MTRILNSSGSYLSFAHKILWDACNKHLNLSKQNPADAWHFNLSALLLGAAAFEGYLNYVGAEIIPHIWKDEKHYFNQDHYKGLNGKLKRISEEIDLVLEENIAEKISSLKQLQSTRDKIMHPRIMKKDWLSKHSIQMFPKTPSPWLRNEIKTETVVRLLDDAEMIAVYLHEKLLVSDFRHCIRGTHPFRGMLGTGSLFCSDE